MKRIIIAALAALVALSPAGAQNRKLVKAAKEDAKYEYKYLTSEGYKALDDVKLKDAVEDFMIKKYTNPSWVEVKGTADKVSDLNEAKALARNKAIGSYPAEEVSNVLFIYKKNRRKFDVVCYALVHGTSAAAALNNPQRYSNKDKNMASMEQEITAVKAEMAKKEAMQAAKEAKAKAKKEAKKQAKKAKAKAEKSAQKAAKETYKTHMEKAGY